MHRRDGSLILSPSGLNNFLECEHLTLLDLAVAQSKRMAPYNAQVRTLRAALPDIVHVGTVDEFQGQEAPTVFHSTASSSGADLPRHLEFLFSRNRLNVAISRAQCPAIVVGGPRLLDVRCRTVEQMRMVNALCRLVETAEQQTRIT